MKRPVPSQAELFLFARIMALRLGWLGFVGVLLIALWGVAEFGWKPRLDAQAEYSASEIRTLRQQIVLLNAEGVRNLDPQAKLQALLAAFPSRRQLPLELARLEKTLADSGVRVDSAEYQPDPIKGDFSAIAVNMVVKVSYPQLRAVFDAVRETMPTVAIDDVQLKRDV